MKNTRAGHFLDRFNDLDRDNMHDNEMIAQHQLNHLINLMSAKATEIYNMAPDSIDGTRLFIFKDNSWIILSNPIQECYRADIDAGTDSTGLAEPEFLRLK